MFLGVISTLLRLLSYLFLRWIPGALFPKVISALYVVYVFALYSTGGQTESRLLWSLLGGRGYRKVNCLTLLINTVLLCFVLDATFGEWLIHDHQDLTFARVGYVTSSSAKITIRLRDYQGLSLCLSTTNVPSQEPQTTCQVLEPDNDQHEENDFLMTKVLYGLLPDAHYQFVISNEARKESPLVKGSFRTSPPLHSKWSFLASSCIIPNFPYNPLLRNHINGWQTLYEDEIENVNSHDLPRFMFFVGDFLYYDLPYFPPFSTVSYFKKYRTIYASNFRKVYENLPFVHVYDDHDIVNNYDSGEDTTPFPMAYRAFEAYHGKTNPDPAKSDQSWYSYRYGSLDFFLLDTRRFRSKNILQDDAQKTMLGADQLADLLAWIRQESDAPFRFMVSSIPFTENWKGVDGMNSIEIEFLAHLTGHLDTWGGFLTERLRILEAIRSSERDLIVISGDRHEFAATVVSSMPTSDAPGKAIEFSISPLNQFYLPIRTYTPHANDTQLNYSPSGNIKWGKFTVDTTGPRPRLDFELKIHGRSAWNYTILGSGHGR